MRILSVGAVVSSDISKPRGYGRAILGSLAALRLRGHEVSYLQLGRLSGRKEGSKPVDCVAEEQKVKINVFRLGIQNTNSEINNLFWYLSAGRRRYFIRKLNKYLDFEADVIISEANQLWYFGEQVAKFMKTPNILRVHSIRGIYAPYLARASGNLKEILKCPLSIAHTIGLAQLSDYVITLTHIEERALRRALVCKASTVEGTYVCFPEEVTARAFELGSQDPYVLVMKGDSHLIAWLAGQVHIPFITVGETTEELKAAFRTSNIRKNLITMGDVDNEKLASIIKGAMIIIRPQTFSTGLAMGLVEALAYGKCMITTSIVASKLRNLRSGVQLIIEDDFARWPAIIKRLIYDDELRERIEANAKQYFTNSLSVRRHGEKLEKILNTLC